MALDNANFISELSIVDPPGTDPLSQGDDQIRTVKRATQQSFPNISAAVTLTDIQMNLAAIKNEANVFTALQTIQSANLSFDAAVDSGLGVRWLISGIQTWNLRMANVADGNDFEFRRFDVLGALVDIPWTCSLTTGVVDFLQVPTVAGAPLWVAGELRIFVVNTTPGTNWFVADGLNGTVNLDDRVLVAEGTSVVGTNLNPNLVGTAATGTTGATAITEAQMPSHSHAIGMTQGTSNGVSDSDNIEDQAVGTVADDPTRNFHLNVPPTGGGGTHTHSIPTRAVTENGTGRDVVRPRSRTVQYHQYVP